MDQIRARLGRLTAAAVTGLLLLAPTPVVAAADAGTLGRSVETDRCVVEVVHSIFLDRSASDVEQRTWADRFAAGEPHHLLPQELAASDEWLTVVVTGLYQQALDRGPDADGLAFWVGELRRGAFVNRVAALIYGSGEYLARAGGTATGFVSDLYRRILHREPDAAGLTHWEGRVATSGRGRVASLFFASVESRADRVDALYQEVLARPADAAGRTHWIGRLATVNDVRLAVLLASGAELAASACARMSAAFADEATTRAHRVVLGREPTPDERADWAGRLADRPFVPWLVASLMATAEHRSGSDGLSTDAFVAQAATRAGTALTASEHAAWVADIDSGRTRPHRPAGAAGRVRRDPAGLARPPDLVRAVRGGRQRRAGVSSRLRRRHR